MNVTNHDSKCHREQAKPSLPIVDLDRASVTQLCSSLGLEVRYRDFEEVEDTSVSGYDWLTDMSENDQKQRYMEYLDKLVYTGPQVKSIYVENGATHETLLDANHERLPFTLRGTADVVLVDKQAKRYEDLLVGLRTVIMVRQTIAPQHKAQAIGQLLSASLNVPKNYSPVSLLTDLNDKWYFIWLGVDDDDDD